MKMHPFNTTLIEYAMKLCNLHLMPFNSIEANIECAMNNDANSMHNWNMLLAKQIDFLLIFFFFTAFERKTCSFQHTQGCAF